MNDYFRHFYNRLDLKRFYYPGRLFSGFGSISLLSDIMEPNSSILFFCDQKFSSYEFGENDISKIIVESEPKESALQGAIQIVEGHPDYVVSLGGGSTIDSAKAAVAYFRCGDFRINDNQIMKPKPVHISIPTMVGSGSETSRCFVLSEPRTNFKKAARNWAITPDFAILDPQFIESAPLNLLVSGLFDSFTHLWETFICRGESSPFSDAFAYYYLPKLLEIVKKDADGEQISRSDLIQMQQISAIGGIAISNTRTGLMHTLGESFVSSICLPHPLSLIIFYREVIKFYWDAISKKVKPILSAIKIKSDSPDDLIETWESIFNKYEIRKEIDKKVKAGNVDFEKIMASVRRDTVLSKENPIDITFPQCETILRKSIQYLL